MKERKNRYKINYISIMLIIILLTLFSVSNINPIHAETINTNYVSNSIIEWTMNNDLPNGNYNIIVNGKTSDGTEEAITYPVELINYYENTEIKENTSFGDPTNTDKKMLIVKFHGNLTIDSDVTVTITRNGNYTYYKGLYINVEGTLKNNGTISMTARGTYNQEGENVYLWKNLDNTFEYVPAVGANGAPGTRRSSEGRSVGTQAVDAILRQTGGGSSGAAHRGASYSYTVISGAGGNGTSYSGGAGGGAITARQVNWTGYSGSSTGGAGGTGRYKSSTSGYSAGGGAGNPGGSGVNGASAGGNGTGGLLIIYAINYDNNGIISSEGTSGGLSATRVSASGGGSGGGSINIFYQGINSEGTLSATGGATVSNGGTAGGTGTATTTQLVLEEEYLKPTLSNLIVNGELLTPTFDKNTNTYNLTLNSEKTNVKVDATLTNDENYITSGIGNFDIPSGKSVHNIVLTSKIGIISTYTINIYRPASSYQYLNGIKVNGINVDNFSSEKLNYNVTVPYDADSIKINAIKGRPSQQVIGTEKNIDIPSGSSIHIINVISEDGQKNSSYTLTINREHTSKLKSLSVEGYDLDIDFDSETYKYYVDIPSNLISLNINTLSYDEEAKIKVTGNGYIKGNSGTIKVVVTEPNSSPTTYTIIAVKEGQVPETPYEFSYTGSYQEFEAPNSAYYKVELWGARGGYGRRNMSLVYRGGFGSYTSGEIYLEKGQKIYVYVGSSGLNGASVNKYTGGAGGYNGGAYGGHDKNHDSYPDPAGGGGGSTDVRLDISDAGLWDNFDSLKSRIMVSGGGAGGAYGNMGGAGGSLNDINGYKFGIGQAGFTYNSGSGGGAGGYYGGKSNNSDGGHGYGGTSYVSGCTNCKSISEDSVEDNVLLTDDNVHYSGYKFENIQMYTGDETMPSTTTGYTTGNNGDGFARITAIPNKSSNNYLNSLTSNVGTLSPAFSMENQEYNLSLSQEDALVTLSAKTEDSTAQVSGIEPTYIKSINDKIEVTVTAEDGSTRIYTVNTVRQPSSNTDINDINIEGLVPSLCSINSSYCKLNTKFDKNVHDYYMTVPGRIKNLEFVVTKGHYFQSIIGDGVVSLKGGENKYTIEVTSEDGSKTNSYTYTITRDMTGNTVIDNLDVNTIDIIDDGSEIKNPIDIAFDSAITEYYFSIPNKYTEVSIDVVTDDENAKYEIIGNKDFVVGNNIVQIKVTATNGEIGYYTLNVYREENTNIFLKELNVYNGDLIFDLNPKFIKTLNTYSLNVNNSIETINIDGIAESDTTQVSGNGNKLLSTGLNSFEIITTSESGEIGTYIINVTRDKSSDTSLKTLNITGFDLSPEFNSDSHTYQLNVDPHTKNLDILAEPTSDVATVKITGNTNLKLGLNSVKIMVTAEDGSTGYYIVNVTKILSDNNNLESINIDEYDISTSFDKDVLEYNIVVQNEIKSLNINAIPEDYLSNVTGNGKYSLQTGDNQIFLQVTSESGISKTYTLNVKREYNSNNNILMINFDKDVNLTPQFSSEITAYSINVENEIDEITLNSVPEVLTTNIIGNGTYKLMTGKNDIKLISTSENGEQKIYTLSIFRDINNSLNLKYLNVKEGRLSPEFNKKVVRYSTIVSNDITNLSVLAEAENPDNTIEISDTSLSTEKNDITITVKNSENEQKVYTIITTRQEKSKYNLNLESLSIENVEIEPVFTGENIFYEATVPYSVDNINVIAKQIDEKCAISGNNTYSLNVGKNNIYVQVTDPDNIIKTYQIVVERLESDDARIKNLTIENMTLMPDFNSDIYEYSLSTRNSSLNLNLELMNKNARYVVIGNEHFSLGNNTVYIDVTSADKKNTKRYTINVNKLPSNNNNLLTLSVENQTITPEFSKNVTVYYLTVDKNINTIELIGQSEDENAVIEGLGIRELMIGENIIEVSVISESGNTKNYTLIVTRKGETENRLDNIYIDDVPIKGFDPDVLTYNLDAPYESSAIDISVDKKIDNSIVSGIGNKILNVGKNTVDIIVTSENGDIKTYTLNINRKEIVSSLLDDIKIKYYSLMESFNSDIYKYNILVDNEMTSLDISPVLRDPKATYTILNNDNFTVGINRVYIEVTASDGIQKTTYELDVNRQIYSNTFLEYISTNKGTLVPSFDKNIMEYIVDVDKDVDNIIIDSEATSNSSTVSGNGTYTLFKGDNIYPITVTSNIGVTRTYKLNVRRAKSGYNLLNNLVVLYGSNKISLSPTFDPLTNEYTANIEPGIDKINISGDSLENATITGLGDHYLVGGTNNIEVVVTSESGIANTYKLVLTREKSNNNYLTSLVPSVGELSPEFTYENTNYTMTFDSSKSLLSFEYTTEDRFATVSGADNKIIEDGSNVRQIIVTAEDGSKRIYNITINKDRTDESRLESLEMSGYTFDKDFNSDIHEYNVTVENSKTLVTSSDFVAVAKDLNATVSKMSSLELLTTKINQYKIIVTAQDGFTTSEYIINITRQKGNKSKLSELSFYEGTLSSNFDPDKTDYILKIPNSIKWFGKSNLKYKLEDSNATIQMDTINLNESKLFKIIITAEDGSSSTIYNINLEYELSNNALLYNLYVKDYVMNEHFSSYKNDYSVNIYEDDEYVNVDGSTEDEKATILNGIGKIILDGDNTVNNITVQAEDGTINIYNISINKTKTKEKLLNNVSINDLTNTCGNACNVNFSSSVLEYKNIVPYETNNIKFDITKISKNQIVNTYLNGVLDNSNNYALEVGMNKFTIEVQNTDLESTTYLFNIQRLRSNNNYLKSLNLSNPVFDFEDFNKNKTEYNYEVDYDVEKIEVKAETEDSNSTISVYNNNYLSEGMNDISIIVTAPNGDEREYIIHVIRNSEYNNYLKSLTISSGIIYKLSPIFNKAVTNYKVTVPTSITHVSIEGELDDETSIATGIGEFDLNVGTNKFNVSVTAKSGEIRIYSITINREQGSNAFISNLEINNGKMLPTFDKEVDKYFVDVSEYINSLDMNIELEDENATYNVSGNSKLETGQNIVQIKVTSEDKKIVKTYTLVVTKSKSTNDYLSMIKINGSNIVNFDKNKIDYDVQVDNDILSANIEYVRESNTSIVSGNGVYSLKEGLNVIKLTVLSESGTQREYTINLYRKYNNYLSTLVTDRGDINPAFDKKTMEYNLSVPTTISDITVIGIKDDSSSIVSGNGKYNLKLGINEIKISVEAVDHDVRNYVINVVREKSDNNYLSMLSINEGVFDKTFKRDSYEYNTEISNEYNSVTVNYLTEDKNSIVEIIGNENLNEGENTIIIRVTASNGSIRDYKIIVNKQSEEIYSNYLTSLTTSTGTLSPVFDKEINQYTVSVPETQSSIVISGIRESNQSTVTGFGNHNLIVGRNEIPIQVTSKDGKVRTYKLVIYRQGSSDARLSNLMFEEGVVTPVFNRNIFDYKMNISANVINLTELLVTTVDEKATYEIIGNTNLISGENMVTVRVTAADGITKLDYNITVVKEKNSIARLLSLSSNIGTLIPAFDKDNSGVYTINVSNDTKSIILSGEKEFATSTVTGLGFHELAIGNNSISVNVTSETGNITSYAVNVVRGPSSNCYLSNLGIKNYDITPAFDKMIDEYTLTLADTDDINMIEIYASAEYNTSTISGLGVKNIDYGNNTYEVLVTSPSGNTNVYTINVVKPYVESSKILKLSAQEGELSPIFEKNNYLYDIYIPNEKDHLTLDVQLEDENSSYVINNNSNFKIGSNIVDIIVTTKSGNSSTYTINAIRQISSNNYLKELSISNGNLNPIFDKYTINYNVEVSSEVDSIDVKAIAEDINSTIEGNGIYSLEKGINVIKIKVLSSSLIERLYTINVTRKNSDNNLLSSLSIDNGELNPIFDSNTNEYDVTLSSNIENIEINALPVDTNSIVSGIGTKTITKGLNTFEITVTSESGLINIYTINVNRQLSSDLSLLKFEPDVGVLDKEFSNYINEYTLDIDSNTTIVNMNIVTNDKNTIVNGEKLITIKDNITQLDYSVVAENGDSKTIHLTINKKEEIKDIELNKNNVVVVEDETDKIDVTIIPNNITSKIIFEVEDDSIISVDGNGEILGLKKGITTIKVYPEKNPTIIKEVNVEVLSKKIISSVYEIYRDKYDYITGMEEGTTLSELISDVENESSTVKIYDQYDIKIDDLTEVVKTGQVIKLEVNGKIYDQLIIVLRGDFNNDGVIDVSDKVVLQDHILSKNLLTDYRLYAMDMEKDDIIDISDNVKLANYILKKISTLN